MHPLPNTSQISILDFLFYVILAHWLQEDQDYIFFNSGCN